MHPTWQDCSLAKLWLALSKLIGPTLLFKTGGSCGGPSNPGLGGSCQVGQRMNSLYLLLHANVRSASAASSSPGERGVGVIVHPVCG